MVIELKLIGRTRVSDKDFQIIEKIIGKYNTNNLTVKFVSKPIQNNKHILGRHHWDEKKKRAMIEIWTGSSEVIWYTFAHEFQHFKDYTEGFFDDWTPGWVKEYRAQAFETKMRNQFTQKKWVLSPWPQFMFPFHRAYMYRSIVEEKDLHSLHVWKVLEMGWIAYGVFNATQLIAKIVLGGI